MSTIVAMLLVVFQSVHVCWGLVAHPQTLWNTAHRGSLVDRTLVTIRPARLINNQDTGATKKPRSVTTQLQQKALRAFEKGSYNEALGAAEELCKQEPGSVESQFLLGEIAFAAGKMEQCIAAFDAVIDLQPRLKPQLWQRGLALYYAERYADGVSQFESHQTVNSQDVENAVWHLLCAARVSNVATARKTLIPIQRDARIPMFEIYELFAGRGSIENTIAAAEKTSTSAPANSDRHNLQRYYAHLYIGLFHEMQGRQEAAVASLKKAVAVNPLNKNNFMGQVARIHLKLRTKKTKSPAN